MPTWILYVLASAFFAGLTSVIAKFGLKNVPSDLGLAVRTFAVYVFVWVIAIVLRHTKEMGSYTKRDIVFLLLRV